jgi:putative DNA primase/helicase
MAIAKAFDTYTERSQSGDGIHFIVKGQKPGDKCKHTRRKIELYDKHRFFVMTGEHIEGTPLTIEPRQAELDTFYFGLFPKEKSSTQSTQQSTGDIPADDEELLKRMFASANGAKIESLWNGDTSIYNKDDSSADLALCNYLAFWTGNDAARMDRMFRQSKLFRDKWLRQDYRMRTIDEAIAATTEVYRGAKSKHATPSSAEIGDLPTTTVYVNGNGAGHEPPPPPSPATKPFIEYSDLATAEFAYSLYGKEVVYTPTHGWMRNAGTHLTTDQAEAHAQRRVNDALRQQASVALATGNTELLKRSIPDSRNTRNALYQFKSLVTISTADLDRDPHLLNTLSGVVDLRVGEVVGHEMSNRFTYCIHTEYKPNAHVLTRPLYSVKLAEWFNQELDTVGFIERALGYGLTGETKEELMIWLQGQRRSGKGTLLNTVQEMLGAPLAMSLSMKALTTESDDPQHFALAPLRPARFVVASESKQHQRLDSGLLKWITGRDTIQVAHKGKDPFQMKPQFKLFAMSNYLPNIDAGDDAMHGRVKIVKMPNSYYGQEDKELKAALLVKEQRELLLSMLVAQAGFYYKSGLVVPKEVEARAEEVRRAGNPVYGWMGEAIIAKPGNSELLDDWYQSYCAWCEEWGFKPTQKGWFARTLNEAGYPTKTDRPRDENGKQKRVVTVENGQLDG